MLFSPGQAIALMLVVELRTLQFLEEVKLLNLPSF